MIELKLQCGIGCSKLKLLSFKWNWNLLAHPRSLHFSSCPYIALGYHLKLIPWLVFKLRTEAYTSSLGLLTDKLTDSLTQKLRNLLLHKTIQYQCSRLKLFRGSWACFYSYANTSFFKTESFFSPLKKNLYF